MLDAITDLLIAIGTLWLLIIVMPLIKTIRQDAQDPDITEDWADVRTAIRITHNTIIHKIRRNKMKANTVTQLMVAAGVAMADKPMPVQKVDTSELSRLVDQNQRLAAAVRSTAEPVAATQEPGKSGGTK